MAETTDTTTTTATTKHPLKARVALTEDLRLRVAAWRALPAEERADELRALDWPERMAGRKAAAVLRILTEEPPAVEGGEAKRALEVSSNEHEVEAFAAFARAEASGRDVISLVSSAQGIAHAIFSLRDALCASLGGIDSMLGGIDDRLSEIRNRLDR